MVEALLIVIVILLVVDIYVTIKPKGVDMDPIQRNMDQKLISVEKTLREELTINREESRKNEQSNRTEIGGSIEKLSSSI
ncbi:MAG: DNA recombination protein RmuC, partial [Intestinibacter sp.]|nr:DNA recombination protein RmuC [Intestinibacter sp.]